jgi:hypothetical protein
MAACTSTRRVARSAGTRASRRSASFGQPFGLRGEAEALLDLVGELLAQRREQAAEVVAKRLGGEVLPTVVAGVEHLEEEARHPDDGLARRQKAPPDTLPARIVAVAGEQGVDDAVETSGHLAHCAVAFSTASNMPSKSTLVR